MEKIKFIDIQKNIVGIVSSNENSKIFKLNNGEYIKIMSSKILPILNIGMLNFEKKIFDSEKHVRTNFVIKPNAAIYSDNGLCVGYKIRPYLGKTMNEDSNRNDLKEKVDLERYRIIHKNLEKIIKAETDIIFPDLCTCDNIILTKNLKTFLIDYDGMQIGNNPSIFISTTIGKDEEYMHNKKYFNNLIFTKNLDIKSLTYLYFLHTFNAKLSSIGINIPGTDKTITIEDIFNYIGLSDYELYDKVSKIFNDQQDNEYLGESIDRITKDYKMELVPAPTPVGYIKRLIKKY